jgi:hypothetical protein
MGMKTISASQVVDVLAAVVYHDEESRNLAAIAVRKASDVKRQVRNGQVSAELERVGVNFFSAETERNKFNRIVTPGLELTGKADLQTGDMVIKIKPDHLRGRDVLKVALVQTARNEGVGGVYMVNSCRIAQIGNVADLEPELVAIAQDASDILDIHHELRYRPSLKGAARDAINKREISLQGDLKERSDSVLLEIKSHRLKFV